MHRQAPNIGIERFYYYKSVFSPLLASRFSALRADSSLVEVAPGAPSRAVDPLSLIPSILDSVGLLMGGCLCQRQTAFQKNM